MPVTELISSSVLKSYTISAETAAGGAVTALGTINLGGEYTHMWLSIRNGHAAVALTDFLLYAHPCPAGTLAHTVTYVSGVGWTTTATPPVRFVSGAPNTLAAVTTASAYVEIRNIPSISFSASQTAHANAATITIDVTLCKAKWPV